MTVVGDNQQITTLNSDEEKGAGFSNAEIKLIQEIIGKRYARTKNLPPDVESLMLKLKIKAGDMGIDEIAEMKSDPQS